MPETEIKLLGKIEYSDSTIVKGWALNASSPDEPVLLSIYDGSSIIDTITPSIFRWDLKEEGYGMGYHGFIYRVPARLLNGSAHTLRFLFGEDGPALEGGPVEINHSPEAAFTPLHASELTGKKVLVLAASPGDESMSSGGSIALHCRAGDEVKIVFLNDEEQSEAVRHAPALLGVSDIEFWDAHDDPHSNQNTIDKLSELLISYNPGLIYCPSPHEPSPEHRASADIAWRAVQKSRIECTLAFTENGSPLRVNTLVDISSVTEKKKAACDQYVSSSGGNSLAEAALGLSRYRSSILSNGSRYAEGFFLIDSSEVSNSPIEKFSREQFFSSAGALPLAEPPLVSIIIRTWNRDSLVKDAISSVVMQSYPNIEIVLVNDGESDLTELVSEFRKYIDIQYINPEKNLGMAGAANLGFKAAKGKYVNLLDDDDVFYSGHVSKLARYLHTTGQRAAFSDCEVGNYEWGDNGFTLKGEKKLAHAHEHDLDKMMVSTYFPNMLLMCEKSLIEKIGYMDDELPVCEDWDLWIKLCQEVSPERIPGVTAEYRFFADHNYDFTKWRTKILEKHKQYHQNENIDVALLNRIDMLVIENSYLRKRLAGEYTPENFEQPRNQTMWKILYTLKKILPEPVVKYLQSKNYKL